MQKPRDWREGMKHSSTAQTMRHLRVEVMELCESAGLYQIDLLNSSKERVSEAEYWARRRGQQKLDRENAALTAAGQPSRQKKFETVKDTLRKQISSVLYRATSFEDFSDRLLQQYGIAVKESREQLSYLPAGRTKFIRAKHLGDNYDKKAVFATLNANAEHKPKVQFKQDTIGKLIDIQARLIVWIFTMRVLMIITSVVSYLLNNGICKAVFGKAKAFNFETPLTSLVWLTSLISILVTFGVSYVMIGDMGEDLWWKLSVIISCGTFAAAIIPEFTKIFTSSKSKHVQEIVNASREAGASLNIISGIVAGNFSAFWKGLVMVGLMVIAFFAAREGLDAYMVYPTVFAFGLVAFGMLGMGPVTIAVDSYGPVTDNAQSVFELSQIEQIKGIDKQIKKDYGFEPEFETGKQLLEENDSAGNTFKATAKPVLIGTAVIGATTMIFSIILLLNLQLNLLDPYVLFGLMLGGAVIYWFSGASMQAVSTGAYRAVNYIKEHIKLDTNKAASIEDSKSVVKICTIYAQKGMLNIFIVIFSFTIAFACFDANLFASYLISIAIFGLYQALYMANAGGAWDNAKKVVEVDLHEKGSALHDAAVVGDTVGDPYKDTSSVALNPIIKFTTLFGLLAVEMAVAAPRCVSLGLGIVFFLIGLVFVWRSFYRMRIEPKKMDN